MGQVHELQKLMLALRYKEPTVDQPDIDELADMADAGIVDATDGCQVEPDGECQHGYPSWLLYLGYI